MWFPARLLAATTAWALALGAWGNGIPTADRVVVLKSERKLLLIKNTEPYREYKICAWLQPKGSQVCRR